MQITTQTNARRLALALALLAFAAASFASLNAPSRAQAVTVGIGDNSPSIFFDARYQSLGTKISRKVIPYDFYHYADERSLLAQWLAGAKANNVEPLIAFSFSTHHRRSLPSVGSFQKSLRYLRAHYPEVRNFSPWNEANHASQPTYKHPKRAAQYYNTSRKICRGCQIVAADVLDQANMIPWVKTFRRYANKPSLWGLHSYADANKNVPWSKSAAKKLLASVKGNVWLTEVGGLVAFKNTYRYSERRAANATTNTLRLAHKSSRIKRVYFYSWYGTPRAKQPYPWDSGLVNSAGEPRPGYFTLKRWLSDHPADL